MSIPDTVADFTSTPITLESKTMAVIAISFAMTVTFLTGLLYRSYHQQIDVRVSNMSSQDSITTRRNTAMNELQVALIDYERNDQTVINRIHDDEITIR